MAHPASTGVNMPGSFRSWALVLTCLASIVTTGPRCIRAQDTPQPSQATTGIVSFARDIYPIFQSRCAECHQGDDAKGGLNIQDRDAVLGYLTAGSVEKSPLWTDYLMANPNEEDSQVMPPASKGKLPAAELALLRTWIVEGAVWEEVAQETKSEPKEETPSLSFGAKFWKFQGYFHPAVIHLPIALILVSGMSLCFSWFTGKRAEDFAVYCLVLGALFSVLAVMMGWSLAETMGYPSWKVGLGQVKNATFFWHRWLGVSTAIFSWIVMALALLARRSQKRTWIWKVGLLLLVGLVSWVGHQGGELNYGEAFFHEAFDLWTK